MYQMTLRVIPFMSGYHVAGAIAEENSEGDWRTVSTFSEHIQLPDSWDSEDAVASMIEVIREWSVRTISR